VTLSVTATPTPLQYQWFRGSRGNGSPIQGATERLLTVTPTTTTNYWVRVSNGCEPAADSDTATVTVNGCPAVVITGQSRFESILEGRSIGLSVATNGGSGLTYQWFVGESGTTGTQVPDASGGAITVSPATSTKYWVRVTNFCGAFDDSETINVTVTECKAPRIVLQPVGGEVLSGDAATLFALVKGTTPIVAQWYQGTPPDRSSPVPNASGTSARSGTLLGPASFWMHASSECGEIDSAAAFFTVTTTCRPPSIVRPPASLNVPAGSTAILAVAATGTSLTYLWYQGPTGDRTHRVGGNAPAIETPAITATTQFWVTVEGRCGSSVSTAAITVTPTGRRRAAGR
jgi:hypothetical protein